MKNSFYIIVLFIIGCSSINEKSELDERIVFSNDSWWLVNFDSLTTIENYILSVRELRKTENRSIKPYIITSNGKRISLREIRKRTGAGYIWYGGVVFNVYVKKNYCEIYDNRDESNRILENNSELYKEVLNFYKTATKKHIPDSCKEYFQTDIEVFITPNIDTMYGFNDIIETVALAYQEFKIESKDTLTPFQISIMSSRIGPIERKNKTSP